MAAWPRPIVTDSGGFQAYSIIREGRQHGRIGNHEIAWRAEDSDRTFRLTPEKSVQLQLRYGADIVICLDQCTHPDDPEEVQEQSVRRTVAWAARGKKEFERIVGGGRRGGERPQLFAVIQGGVSRELRRRCAEELLTIGFDGFGYGGWPVDSEGKLLQEMFAYTRELVPAEFPLHALGVGHPANIVEGVRLGYDLFDSSMPSRDARHGRLYAWRQPPTPPSLSIAGADLVYVYVFDAKHAKASDPIMPGCDCYTCASYSLGYLHLLAARKDSLYMRLSTIHNLRFMVTLMQHIRDSDHDGG
jgi:queuine tRNA-ribosyltransferase